MAKIVWLLVALSLASTCDAYRILAMFPMASKSHYILAKGLVNALLDAGHEVTQVTPYPDKNLPTKLRQIDVSAVGIEQTMNTMNVTAILNNEKKISLSGLKPLLEKTNRDVLLDPNMQKLLSDTTDTYDVVIAVWMLTDVYAGLGNVFNCPIIWFSTVEPHSVVLRLIDEQTNPAYVPNGMSSNVPPYDFINRVKELFAEVTGTAFFQFYLNGYFNSIYDEILVPHIIKRGRPVVPFDEIKYNVSLMLGNSHVSLGVSTRLPQSYKEIGGYHIDRVQEQLPKDLKKILDNAKNGLIYFSMGSVLKSKDLPDALKRDLLEVLGNLKQIVLWKFEDVLPKLPSNVHIVNWAPQQSILAHPNCILFITHGGLLSITEAIHFGKPIVGIPVFGDQFNNVDRAVKKGFALKVSLAYDMKDQLKEAIHEFLENKRYTEQAKELSLIYHDRPIDPRKELVHWVEHVVKTRGAPHLRSPALDVPLYQKLYLDLLALVIIVLYILKKIVMKICCSKKTLDKKLKKN